jgi:hypothetical protein
VHLVAAIAVRIRVAHDHDLPAKIDAHLAKLGEVLGTSAVRVDDLGLDFAGCRILVIGDDARVRVEIAILVLGMRFFLQVQRELDRPENVD